MNKYQNYTNVATILADPEKSPIDDNEINSVVDALSANGAIIENVDWLSQSKACDIYFAVLEREEANEILTHLLVNVPFDFVVQRAGGRKKKLLISDMDSTIIQQECIDELADFVGLKPKVAEITARAMNGELDFKSALKERVALLKGLSEEILQEAYDKHISLTPGAKSLTATMKANGARCVLVSGGFTFFTRRVAEKAGFEIEEANILEIEDGLLTGKVREPILDKEAKLNSLKFHMEELGIGQNATLAMGDGANDLPMLQYAGLGIAFHARPRVKAQARAKIDHCGLDAALYVQGYRESEIRI